MNRKFLISTAIILILTSGAHSQNTPSPSKEDAQRLATGQITDINVKKKILTVRAMDLSTPTRTPSDTGTGRRGGGGTGRRGGGGGGRGGGVGIPFPGGSGGGGRGGRVPAPAPSSKDQGKKFKVTVTDKTTIKDSTTTISFGLLRVGDRISIQGLPKKGDDLEATEITVN